MPILLLKEEIRRGCDDMVICLLVLGGVIGFAAGFLGIGGGILLMPFLTMLFSWKAEMPAEIIVYAAYRYVHDFDSLYVDFQRACPPEKGTINWKIVFAMTPGIVIGGLLSGGAAFVAISTA